MVVLRESTWCKEILQGGEQQKVEGIARNMLAAELDPTQIAQLTGLSLVQIQQLQVE